FCGQSQRADICAVFLLPCRYSLSGLAQKENEEALEQLVFWPARASIRSLPEHLLPEAGNGAIRRTGHIAQLRNLVVLRRHIHRPTRAPDSEACRDHRIAQTP